MKLGIALPTSHQGVYLPSPFAGGEEIADIARMAERYGFDSAWVLDFMTPSYARHEQPGAVPEWYEALTSLAYVAAVTDTIRLGTAVVQLPLRDPFLLARQAATLDALSGGRCLLGVGLGQARSEFEGLRPGDAGVRRGDLLEEGLDALHRFFAEECVSIRGAHYQCRDLRLTPRPVQAPFPIYLSGTTERTPSRVARWGSGWFLSRAQSRSPAASLAALDLALEAARRERRAIDVVVTRGLSLGRDRDAALVRFNASMLPGRMDELASEYGLKGRPSIDRVFEQNLIGSPHEVAGQLDAIRATGVDHCVLMYFAVTSAQALLEQLQWFGEAVLPLLDWRTARSGSPAPLDRERRRGAVS